MVEMHSGICEDIAGNSTNISPKRGVGGSNPLWDARKHRCKPFFGVCSVFLFLLLPVISLLLPGDFYAPHDVYLLIGLERFSEIC